MDPVEERHPYPKVNQVTAELQPYPMEELARIRRGLIERQKPVYDFGTGDPKVATWPPIREALLGAVPSVSQYPTIRGLDPLRQAQLAYLERRFGLAPDTGFAIAPTQGSKEAIFHTALCLVGRSGGCKHIIYPDPGYPVYRSSTLFAGGIPYPVTLSADNGYLLEPWTLPAFVQKDAAAIWVNYPHNPTGATAPRAYWEQLIDWARETDTILLSDDCYVDIYDSQLDEDGHHEERPITPLALSHTGILSFMSLSKRSGMTGYRSGFMAGDPELIEPILRARANFGVGCSEFVQAAAQVAWHDEDHVTERRRLFSERMAKAGAAFQELGLLTEIPRATFYLWVQVPSSFGGNDLKFCLALAEKGVICSPAQWLGEATRGYVRFALTVGLDETNEALAIVRKFLETKSK